MIIQLQSIDTWSFQKNDLSTCILQKTTVKTSLTFNKPASEILLDRNSGSEAVMPSVSTWFTNSAFKFRTLKHSDLFL